MVSATAEPPAIPEAEATFIAERMQYALVAPGAIVPVSGMPAADAQVEVYAPEGAVAAAVQDATLATGHTVIPMARASADELPDPRVTTELSELVTVPVLVTTTPPVVVVCPERKVNASVGPIVSVSETVPPVTVPPLEEAAPFQRA
ncbi:hypothetical protein ASF88_02305 [Leifsonia sp. Leaf336]|nr:hypothetical protein ASF88_02305 [Leifsonia sp. Leaf336]